MKSRSDDLEIFLQVVSQGGFSAAADYLDMPVATISRAVQRLENRLQTTLLIRTTRKVTLSEEGAQFAQHVRKGLDQLNFAEDQLLQQHQKPQGRLRVDAASPFMLHQIVDHVGDFQTLYPDISLELVTSEGIIDLIERRTDLAIRVGGLDDSSLHGRVLGVSPLYMVASPEYLAVHGRPVRLSELTNHRLLGFTTPAPLNVWPFGDKGAEAKGGTEITPDLKANSGEVLRQLCLAGNGVACLSGFMVGADLTAGRLISLMPEHAIKNHPRHQVTAVYYKNTALSSRIRAFLDFIKPRLIL